MLSALCSWGDMLMLMLMLMLMVLTLCVVCVVCAGNAEWEDEEHSRVRVMWRTTEALAADVYAWVSSE